MILAWDILGSAGFGWVPPRCACFFAPADFAILVSHCAAWVRYLGGGSAALTGLGLRNLGIAKMTASTSHKPPLPVRLHQMSPNNSRLPDRLIRSALRLGDGCWRAVYFAGQDISLLPVRHLCLPKYLTLVGKSVSRQ